MEALPAKSEAPLYMLFSTANTFTITPLPAPPSIESDDPSQPLKSLVIDKYSHKMMECGKLHLLLKSPLDVVMKQDAEWVIEIQGLLGVINILGHEHLLVLISREEVCRVPSPIYELQDVELIPFNE